MADDEDEGVFGGEYEDGHWIWDENTQSLMFVSDLPPQPVESIQMHVKAPTGAIEFRDDVDLIEQIRYRRRYQRKLLPGQADVITLQDVKDIALYTAPISILSPMLIDLLHIPTTERFLRALILCCAYYLQVKEKPEKPLQKKTDKRFRFAHEGFRTIIYKNPKIYEKKEEVADEMSERMLELQTKVRTPMCDRIENVFRDNLADLRILVAKEYCIMLIAVPYCLSFPSESMKIRSEVAVELIVNPISVIHESTRVLVSLRYPRGADTKKFHHMGPQKKRQSLSDKDARLFETLLRMSIQIVWLALGRNSYNRIELETNRMFKSEIFNNVEHTLKTGYIAQMVPAEQNVLLGPCVRRDKKLNTRSPLMNEVGCDRSIDYRLMGLGVVNYPKMTSRLNYLQIAVGEAEERLEKSNLTLGIIGLPRSNFDTMLRPVVVAETTSKSKSSVSHSHAGASQSTYSSKITVKKKPLLYPPIVIPEKDTTQVYFPPSFPDENFKSNPVSKIQHKRWLNRLTKLLGTPQHGHH